VNPRYLAALLLSVALILGIGCASPQPMPASGSHPAVDPSQVVIYQKQPNKKYEILGTVLVQVGGDVRWDNRGDANAGFELLKSKAAANGANGIILQSDDPAAVIVVAGYKGTYYNVPVKPGTPSIAMAQAIYVVP
jgi:hypothetical protein